MRIISWNINGLRNRYDELKNLVSQYAPDYLCIQKVRCNEGREDFEIEGYRQWFLPIDIGSWSGVMIYANDSRALSRISTDELSVGGHLQAYDCSDFILVNAYVPFANSSIAGADGYRKQWDSRFIAFIKKLALIKPLILCGDFNVVHTRNDSFEREFEQNRPCFSSEERANFCRLLDEANLVDVYRHLHPGKTAATFFGNFRGEGIGNRIDYFLVSNQLNIDEMQSEILSDFGSGQSVPIILNLNPNACRSNDNPRPMISLEEASQWLVSMAAVDGVVSALESKLLEAFAKRHNIDYRSLLTKARAIADGIDVPEVETVDKREMKGRKFEEYIVSLCSDKSRFRLLAWRGDKISGNTYALDTLMPDLHIRHFIDGSPVEYYIECKYRTTLTDDTLDLSSQLGRYRRMSSAKTNSELFLAIGLGGTPSNPDELYIIPSRMIKKDYIIKLKNFSKCRCAQDPESFHNYINHFYQKRVYKNVK